MTLIDKIVTWWHRRRFQKVASQAVGLLVGRGTAPIHMKRFNTTESPKALQISILEDELMRSTVLQSSYHAIRSVSSDSKTPGCVKHTEFNEYGQPVTETYVTFKKS